MKKLFAILLIVSPMVMAAQSSTSDEMKREAEKKQSEKSAVAPSNQSNSTQSTQGTQSTQSAASDARGMGKELGMGSETIFYGELVVVNDGKNTKYAFKPSEGHVDHFFTKEDLEMINRVTSYDYNSVAAALTYLSSEGWEYVSQYEGLENGIKGLRFIMSTPSKATMFAPGAMRPTKTPGAPATGTGNGGVGITPVPAKQKK